jgi:hypothetical protein
MNEKKFEELRQKMRQRNARFGKLFLSVEGAELLEMLSQNFYDSDLVAETAEKTAFNLGAREVVRYLLELRNHAKGHRMPIKELPDDLRDDPALKDFNDLPALAKSFKETKTFVGRSIQPPGEAATPEQKAEFYDKLRKHAPNLVPLDEKDEKAQELVWEKLGRPKDAKEYDFKPPPEGGASSTWSQLRETAKALGLTKAQFNKMAERRWRHTKVADEFKADQTALKTEWGAAYQEKLDKPPPRRRSWGVGRRRDGHQGWHDEVRTAQALGRHREGHRSRAAGERRGGAAGAAGAGALTPAEAED